MIVHVHREIRHPSIERKINPDGKTHGGKSGGGYVDHVYRRVTGAVPWKFLEAVL